VVRENHPPRRPSILTLIRSGVPTTRLAGAPSLSSTSTLEPLGSAPQPDTHNTIEAARASGRRPSRVGVLSLSLCVFRGSGPCPHRCILGPARAHYTSEPGGRAFTSLHPTRISSSPPGYSFADTPTGPDPGWNRSVRQDLLVREARKRGPRWRARSRWR
jgi:hypothetical protein